MIVPLWECWVRRLGVVVLCVLTVGCTQAAPDCRRLGGTPMLEYHLFFGRSIPGRPPVSDPEWADFTARVVTPHLPDGLTAFDAEGQWRNPATGRIVREQTRVIVVAVPDTPASAAAIAAVKDAYRAEFHQQTVGTTVAPVCAAF